MVLDLDTMEKKGTVTPISSVFSVEDAQKASKQVQDSIVERQQQLDQLRTFTKDNTNLINLVQKLPEEIYHNIMVPFGKAAFFPGRLIHTNEFMVLLGEGYYTERTSKQTVDILKRRGKTLETQVESLKAVMQDLKVEASFFDATAHESAEGLVEIREDYVDEDISGLSPTPDNRVSGSPVSHEVEDRKAAFEDEEYMRILSRISELEKEEEEAEKCNEDEKVQDELVESMHQVDIDESARHSAASFDVKMSEVPMVSKDGPSHGNIRAPKPSMVNKTLEPPLEKAKAEAPLTTSNTAFTGSIVERAQHIDTAISEQPASARPSKPVSRFKMQRK